MFYLKLLIFLLSTLTIVTAKTPVIIGKFYGYHYLYLLIVCCFSELHNRFDRCKAHGHYYFVTLDNVLLIYKEMFWFGDDFQYGGSITRYVLLKMSLKNGRQSV